MSWFGNSLERLEPETSRPVLTGSASTTTGIILPAEGHEIAWRSVDSEPETNHVKTQANRRRKKCAP